MDLPESPLPHQMACVYLEPLTKLSDCQHHREVANAAEQLANVLGGTQKAPIAGFVS